LEEKSAGYSRGDDVQAEAVGTRGSPYRRVAHTSRLVRYVRSRALLYATLRTVKEYHENVAYIHGNPVKAGLVLRPEDWPWSSVHDYMGSVNKPRGQGSPIPVDRIEMPADEETRI
jgi:hypothetical protein